MVEEQFVGRAAETALLDHHFDLARDGQGQLVLVVGPSGIGKTALIRHALRRWDARTVWVSGDPSEVTLAGGVLDQLASQLGVPGVFDVEISESSAASPLGAGKILLDAIGAGSIGSPRVVVVDDANWADDLSLKALTFAFRRMQSSPVLGIVVTRPDAAVHLPSGLSNAAVATGDRIDLGRFNLDDVAQLAQAITEERTQPPSHRQVVLPHRRCPVACARVAARSTGDRTSVTGDGPSRPSVGGGPRAVTAGQIRP